MILHQCYIFFNISISLHDLVVWISIYSFLFMEEILIFNKQLASKQLKKLNIQKL